MMKLRICAVLISMFVAMTLLPAQEMPPQDAIKVVEGIVQKMKECSRRELVQKQKSGWYKYYWGPVANITFDVERTSSVISPYKGIIEFSISIGWGASHKQQEEAENDNNLHQFMFSQHRNTYKIGMAGIVLDSMMSYDVFEDKWKPYKPAVTFCWNSVTKKEVP